MSSRLRFLLFLAVLPLAALLSACIDSSSGSDLVREVGLNVAGLYQGNDGANLVSQTSGADVTQMNITQSGSQITGIDNNGNLYRGNINQVSGDSAGFTMKGLTSSGAEATISGAFNVSGDTSNLSGRWIEPTILASINGSSFVPGRTPVVTNDAAVAVSPAGDQTLSVDGTQQFTASGGDGSNYSWTLSNAAIGSLNRTTGASVTYTASAAGDQTVTVTSGTESTSFEIDQTAAAVALTVTPTGNQSIDASESVSFTASGGDGTYSWSRSEAGFGTLSSTSGTTVTYTAGDETGTQIIPVQSGGETVTRLVNQTAAAGGGTLAISPSVANAANVNSGASEVFTASGGTAPYTWTVSNGATGSVSPMEGVNVTYSAVGTDTQTLTVTDNDGSSQSITIVQQSIEDILNPPTN